MKEFRTLSWLCRACGWRWEVLSVDTDGTDYEEECLSCQSYDTIQVSLNQPLDIIDK